MLTGIKDDTGYIAHLYDEANRLKSTGISVDGKSV
jgi:hypothetical protein